jgi:hypothetical protein
LFHIFPTAWRIVSAVPIFPGPLITERRCNMQWQVLFNVGGWCNVPPALAAAAAVRGSPVRLVGWSQATLARWLGRSVSLR